MAANEQRVIDISFHDNNSPSRQRGHATLGHKAGPTVGIISGLKPRANETKQQLTGRSSYWHALLLNNIRIANFEKSHGEHGQKAQLNFMMCQHNGIRAGRMDP
eukprot:4817023-Alexandrium_andersonii.AAC.1